MIWLGLLVLMIFIPFLTVVFIGAPYVPTLKRARLDVVALAKKNLKPEATVVDLGSGDGSLLVELSQAGFSAIGYELNPYLWLLSNWRLRAFPRSKVRLRSYFKASLPEDTVMIFIFTAGAHVEKIAEKIKASDLQNLRYVISNGFAIEGFGKSKVVGSLQTYKVKK